MWRGHAHVLMNDVECVRVSFLGCEGGHNIQDEVFKKLIDVSKKAGMPHRYEFTASSVA